MEYFFFRNFTKGSDMRIKWSNALRALGMLRYPHYTDLYLFLEIREAFNIPLGDIANIMMKVSNCLKVIRITMCSTWR